MPALPFKLNQDRRHHIPKQKRWVTNSAAYEAALRQRGSLTIWFSDDAIEGWRAQPRTTAGGQPWYSPLAILTALTLRECGRRRWAARQINFLTGIAIGVTTRKCAAAHGPCLTTGSWTTKKRTAAHLRG